MSYIDELNGLIDKIDKSLVDFTEERKQSNVPTQVSSEFLINREQGNWAEQTLILGINSNSKKYIAVKYGKDDDIIAGDPNFKEFYNEYQKELDSIGKRPDILIFNRKDFSGSDNISNLSQEELDILVPKAICGIEVRSSAFLIDEYEQVVKQKKEDLINKIMSIKNDVLSKYSDLLKSKNIEIFNIIENLSTNNVDSSISFRTPSWKSSEDLQQLSSLLKNLKAYKKELEKRQFLSITPKIEDLKVVYKWIQKYNVKHFYVQVFFDKAFGISFKKILELIGNPDLEDKEYFLEGDVKNQNKITIKINANKETMLLQQIKLPEHCSEMKKLDRGRLLFYVKFKKSISTIDKNKFNELFGIEL